MSNFGDSSGGGLLGAVAVTDSFYLDKLLEIGVVGDVVLLDFMYFPGV
jgi:hypothetical protein